MNDNFEKTLRKINKNLTDKIDNFPFEDYDVIKMVPDIENNKIDVFFKKPVKSIGVDIKFNIEDGD
jgi:hypothetical protein